MSYNVNQVELIKAVIGTKHMEDPKVQEIIKKIDVNKCLKSNLKTDNLKKINIEDIPAKTELDFKKAIQEMTPAVKILHKRNHDPTDFPINCNILAPLKVPLEIDGESILKLAEKRCLTRSENEIFEENMYPFTVPKTVEEVSSDHLKIPTPLFVCKNSKDAHSIQLEQMCQLNDIVMVRGLMESLEINMENFKSEMFEDRGSKQTYLFREQHRMPAHLNYGDDGHVTWRYNSWENSTKLTLQQYVAHKEESLKNAIDDEYEYLSKYESRFVRSANTTADGSKKIRLESEVEEQAVEEAELDKKEEFITSTGMIVFGTNVDLLDTKKWEIQFEELKKLPDFLLWNSAKSCLSYLRRTVPGMNGVQLYMKVPGARTSAHQENNNFGSININMGPGDCEWLACPYKYWGKIEDFCRRKKINFRIDPFWPVLEDLEKANIPIYRFSQKAGDLVYLNGGCIHWVQATGWCNNISWNIGPINLFQIRTALISYEYNKLAKFESLIPMQSLAWEFAAKLQFPNKEIFEEIRAVLIRSLAFLKMTLDYVISQGVKVDKDKRKKNCWSNNCIIKECKRESFNLAFVRKKSNSEDNVCVYCAKEMGIRKFKVLQQLPLNTLVEMFDKMKAKFESSI
ncbi:unnamed protein product [Caenorhabditis bovis]|uniref:JmjC domain-containing protein n=1 Tax=Caenorhabditis bovis TaxID=2654633 RepID=A0A8S1FDP6_9PELO|nr:unnamed protein product [Caenorhabditis bovis]